MQQLERFQPRTHRFFRIMVPWYVSKISSHIFPIFPCLLLESHSLLYSSSYLSSSMETAHQLHHHHHHHHQRSWCPAQEAALVPCIEPTFPNSSSGSFKFFEEYGKQVAHSRYTRERPDENPLDRVDDETFAKVQANRLRTMVRAISRTLQTRSLDIFLRSLSTNIFTKAWLESKSR